MAATSGTAARAMQQGSSATLMDLLAEPTLYYGARSKCQPHSLHAKWQIMDDHEVDAPHS
eukprot:354861-Chlamydomonas_euryale.AAC.15